jgi:flagellar biosynthetic protein FliR
MLTVDISKQLSGNVFPFLLVLTRIGSAFMLFPGIGESFVPVRVRMMFALAISFIMCPVLMPLLPPMPPDIAGLGLLLAREVLIGLFFGCLLRLLMGVVETTGAMIGMQTGLSNAMILNPLLATQSALPSAFLSMAAVALVFITGLDHLLLQAMMDTYHVFPAGSFPEPGDVVEIYSRMVTRSFLMGVELAAPFLISGLILYSALGFMQRLMQQVQLFLVVMPVQILGGIMLFGATLAAILSVWLEYVDASLDHLLTP